MPVTIRGGALRTARQALRQVQAVLDQGNIFCYFESRDNELLCCFSPTAGYLPGECVRQGLSQTGALENFLYVEKLDEDYALICMRDGLITKESRAHAISIDSDLRQLSRQLHDQEQPFRFFLYGEEPERFTVAGDVSAEVLDSSLLYWDKPSSSLPSLTDQRRALRRLAPGLLWWQFGAVAALALLSFGLYEFFTQPEEPVPTETVITQTGLDLMAQLQSELKQPAAQQLMQAIYQEYYQILTDATFGEQWRIDKLEYVGAEQRLSLRMSLPQARRAPLELFPEQALQALEQRLTEHVQSLGWTLSGFEAFSWQQTRRLDLPMRDEAQAVRAVRAGTAYWSKARLEAELEPLGELELVEVENNPVYRVWEGRLQLTDDRWLVDWVTGGLSGWLGDYFQDAPLVIDALSLDTRLMGGPADATRAGPGAVSNRGGSVIWRLFNGQADAVQ